MLGPKISQLPKILKKKFVCQSCGKEIKFKIVIHQDPFTKEIFLQCKEEDDFQWLYCSSSDVLELFDMCCDNPMLSETDMQEFDGYFELPAELNKKERAGYCPKCNKNNLIYGDTELQDESFGYRWECPDCGAQGIEWYLLQFEEHIIKEE